MIDAYQTVARKIDNLKPEMIVLVFLHQVMYSNYFHISPGKNALGDFAQFRVPQVQMEVQYDIEFVEQICMLADAADFLVQRENRQLDHRMMVPLYFVNHYVKNYQIVRIGLLGLHLKKHYQLGQIIPKAAFGELFQFSGMWEPFVYN